MKKPKFKIGETVQLKCSEYQVINIISIIVDECPGGTQVHYMGRKYDRKKFVDYEEEGSDSGTIPLRTKRKEKWVLMTSSILDRFNEVELETNV